MKNLILPIYPKSKKLRQLLILAIVVFLVGLVAYFAITNWEKMSDNLSKFPAGLFFATEEGEEKDNDIIVDEDMVNDEFFPLDKVKPGDDYTETAEKGEGITHLARRAIKRYLEQNPQEFEMTAEHKVYAEDYIAKEMGSSWLELGQQVDISSDLITEAISASSELSEEQLDNLTQYSQLVTF